MEVNQSRRQTNWRTQWIRHTWIPHDKTESPTRVLDGLAGCAIREYWAVGLLSGLSAEDMHRKATNSRYMLHASGPGLICVYD